MQLPEEGAGTSYERIYSLFHIYLRDYSSYVECGVDKDRLFPSGASHFISSFLRQLVY
jgi:hypothetical protein